MCKAGIFTLVFFQILFVKAQQPLSPVVNWQQRLGGSSDEAWESMCTAEDGSIVVCGYTSSINGDAGEGQGGTDAWVAKFSSAGQLIWKKRYGGSKLDFANAVALGDGGGFIVAGVSYSNDGDVFENHGYSDAWLLKINDQGEKEWSCLYGGECFEEAVAVQRSVKGGYVVVGGTCSDGMMYQSEHRGLYDGWVFHIDRVGKMIWQHNVGGSGNDYLYHMDQGSDGEWILSGETNSIDGDIIINNGKSDAWLVCMSQDGIFHWSRTYGGEGNDRFFSAHRTLNGTLLASGYFQRGVDFEGWIVKADNGGQLHKQAFYGGGGGDYLVGAVLTHDGGGIFCGSTSSIIEGFSNSGSNGDAWLIKTDSNLNVQWQYIAGGEGADAFVGLSFAGNNRLYMAGYTSSSGETLPVSHGMQDTWLVGMIADLVNEVNEQELKQPLNIFPNPVSSMGVFYLLSQSGDSYTDAWILSSSGSILRYYKNVSNGMALTLTGFSSGQYWLRVRDSKGRIFTIAFLVF
jgi:hypothetical protein